MTDSAIASILGLLIVTIYIAFDLIDNHKSKVDVIVGIAMMGIRKCPKCRSDLVFTNENRKIFNNENEKLWYELNWEATKLVKQFECNFCGNKFR